MSLAIEQYAMINGLLNCDILLCQIARCSIGLSQEATTEKSLLSYQMHMLHEETLSNIASKIV